MTTDETALLERHADVLFEMDRGRRLTGVNEPDGEPAPRLFLARGNTTSLVWLRADVSGATAEAARAIGRGLPAWDGRESASSLLDPIREILAGDAPILAESGGPAFRFGDRIHIRNEADLRVIDEASAQLLEPFFPYTREVLTRRMPVVGVVVDGRVVSACFCARRRPGACEAGVATEESFRGRGYGALVVSAWRDAVEGGGRQPLYSTSWDNQASRAIARRLALIPYAETVSLT